MKYIFIDTNIYIYCALITKGNYTTQTIDSLNQCLKMNNVKLIMPEVVKMEFFKKAYNTFENDVMNNIAKLKKEIQNISFPDYLGEDKAKIENNIDRLLEERKRNLERVSNNILNDIITNQNTVLIELTNDIFLKAYKRALSGEKPYNQQICSSCNNSEYIINADCMIIESIIDYFDNIYINEDDILIFCSNNTKDFAVFNKDKNIHELDGAIRNTLKIKVKYYNNLPELLKKEFNSEINSKEIIEIRNIETDTMIGNVIKRAGVPAHIKGYQFIKEAVLICLKDDEALNSITRVLYPLIAKRFMTTPERIERGIRHAIEVAWNRDELPMNNEFSERHEKPTNSEFISFIVDKIKSEEKRNG